MSELPETKRFFELCSRLQSTKAYLGLVGRPSVRATAKHVGTVSKLKVETSIHYQEYDGASNYHRNPVFDEALAEVIHAEFEALASKALRRMEVRLAEQSVLARSEIEELATMFDKLKNTLGS